MTRPILSFFAKMHPHWARYLSQLEYRESDKPKEKGPTRKEEKEPAPSCKEIIS